MKVSDVRNNRFQWIAIGAKDEMTVNGSVISARLQIHETGDGTSAEIEMHRHNGTSSIGSIIYGARSRGTETAQTVVVNGDRLLSIGAAGFDGTDYALSSRIDFEVDDSTVGANAMGGSINFKTSAKGAQSPYGRLRLGSTETGAIFNEDQRAYPFQFRGQDTANLIYISTTSGAEGIGFGTSNVSFATDGGTRYSRSVYIKEDAASRNNIAIGVYTNTALRGTDFGSFRARGTEASPLAVVSGDWLRQDLVYGHDGTQFITCAGFRYEVANTVSTGVVPTIAKFQTMDNSGTFATRFTIDRDKIIVGSTSSPLSGFDIRTSVGFNVVNPNTSAYTALETDCYIGMNTASYTPTVTLPAASGRTGRFVMIKDRSGNAATNNITIVTSGGNIDGASSYTIADDYGCVVAIDAGSNWFITNVTKDDTMKKVTAHNAATLTLNRTHSIVTEAYTATGAVTYTLPSASSMWDSVNSRGKMFTIQDIGYNAGTNNITINRAGSDTIACSTGAAATSAVINTNNGGLQIVATSASTWAVINQH